MQTLILIRGLPGSGKSTLAEKLLGAYQSAVWVEADHYFMRDGEYCFDASKLKEAHTYCKHEAMHGLYGGKTVIVSNTFTQLWEMKPYIDMAKAGNIPYAVMQCFGQFQNVHGVPEEKIQQMRDRWEKL